MPTYVYRCEQCACVIERRQSFQDPPLTECESCHGRLQRVLQPVGIIFRGSGFYTTDYRNGASGSANSGSGRSESSAAAATGVDAGSSHSESKSASTGGTVSPQD